MNDNNPFHAGERAVQERILGPAEARSNERAIGNALPAAALPYIERLPMAIIGSRDAQGRVWASVVLGTPGFMIAPDVHTVKLDASKISTSADDPLWTNVVDDADVGLLLIDLATRRRLRVNGRMTFTGPTLWALHVTQAYGNCPRYIQRRELVVHGGSSPQSTAPAQQGTAMTAYHKELIARADTLFVASAHPDHGVDASHRGGNPGFVQVLSDTRLRIPDFPGNNMFNTLGNLHCYPRAGIVIPDFQQHRLLQITGTTEIMWHLDRPPEETNGTQRYWEIECEAWRESTMPGESQ